MPQPPEKGTASSSLSKNQIEFIRDRKYLKAVTAKTILWYQQSFRSFHGTLDNLTDPFDIKHRIVQRIVEMRDRGVLPVSVNTWLRVINTYLRWKGADLKLPRLKEEEKIIATLSSDQIHRIISFHPKGFGETRCHVASLLMLDTGLRVSEAMGLRLEHVDLENLLVKVRGKGNKHRLVPSPQTCAR